MYSVSMQRTCDQAYTAHPTDGNNVWNDENLQCMDYSNLVEYTSQPCHALGGANPRSILSYTCKLCGRIFRHQPSLFRHQISAHGRIKNKKGRPAGGSYF